SYVSAGINTHELIQNAISQVNIRHNIALTATDIDGEQPQILFSNASENIDESYSKNSTLQVANRSWQLKFYSIPGLGGYESSWLTTFLPAVIFLSVLFISIFVFRVLTDDKKEIRRANLLLNTELAERQKSEATLIESEERYSSLFNTTTDLIQIVSPDGAVLFANKAWREKLGYNKEDVARGISLFSIIPEVHHQQCMSVFQQVISDGTPKSIETEFTTKDGKTIIVEGHISCKFSGRSAPDVQCFLRDITKQRELHATIEEKSSLISDNSARVNAIVDSMIHIIQMDFSHAAPISEKGDELDAIAVGLNTLQEELSMNVARIRDNEEKFKGLLESAPDAMVIVGNDGKIQLVNIQTEKLFGFSREELIGQEVEILIPERHKKVHPGHRGNFFMHPQARSMGSGVNLFVRHKNGSEIPVEISLSPMETTHGILVSAAIRDITERKKTELILQQKTGQLIEAQRLAHIGSWEWDVLADKLVWSDELCRIYGLEPQEVDFELFLEFVHPDEKEAVGKIIQQAFADHQPFSFYHRIIRADGSERILHGRGGVFTDEKGNVIRMAGTGQDVTESKKNEQELMRAIQMAENANRLKETFLANMSHEIRTPLNAIIGFTDLLIKRKLGEDVLDQLHTIKESGNNLLAIINDILDISKIEAGMVQFEERPMSIREMLRSLQVMFQQRALDKNVRLNFIAGDDIPDILLGDPMRINQIIVNLINNAIKFTNKGSVTVTAKVVKKEEEARTIEFSVEDTGIGIEESKLEYIFGRFQQAEAHTSRTFGGTGLGLSIAKQLVELLGGTIAVKSKLNVGSVFSFTLSIKCPKKFTEIAKKEVAVNLDMETLAAVKILVAEDNPINIKYILSVFSEYNIFPEVVENGKAAVEKVKSGNFDVVLMDMEMPVMNGYDATSSIRNELKSNIPIIAMTAHAMAGEKEKCLKMGMDDYISKPISAELLFEKIYVAVAPKKKQGNSPESKIVNLAFLVKSMKGRKDLIRDTMDIFMKQMPEELVVINNAVGQADYSTLHKIAHRMRSTVSIMGISEMEKILGEMEKLSEAQKDPERIRVLHDELNQLSKQALHEIKIEKLNFLPD
ncbi:MAG TPA: PAS domain S-box protein, partial [Bacteroidia bacterium]|nr:PAS domain S-box protein [Bacteroidia bacterium]